MESNKIQFKEDYIDAFLHTALERHLIYKKKEAGLPSPWTNNPVLDKFFFCNVFRQYDKCSVWIIDNIIPLINKDKNNWPLIILYRYISTYNTFKKLQGEVALDCLPEIYDWLSMQRSIGAKLFSSCFIRNPRVRGGWAETWQVPFHIIEEIKECEGNAEGTYPGNFLNELNSLEGMTNWLSQFSATKGFMGYEYACDFEYTKHFNPIDKYTWANMGPGAKQGMSLLLYGHRNAKMNQDFWLGYAKELLEIMTNTFKLAFPEEKITMREVEHWLCEFQKYVKYYSSINNNTRCKFRKYEGEIQWST